MRCPELALTVPRLWQVELAEQLAEMRHVLTAAPEGLLHLLETMVDTKLVCPLAVRAIITTRMVICGHACHQACGKLCIAWRATTRCRQGLEDQRHRIERRSWLTQHNAVFVHQSVRAHRWHGVALRLLDRALTRETLRLLTPACCRPQVPYQQGDPAAIARRIDAVMGIA